MNLRLAEARDFDAIMHLMRHAQAHIAALGIEQWQDGYPEPELIRADIDRRIGYVLDDAGAIEAYAALPLGNEPIYDAIDGHWLTPGDRYVTVHRLAVNDGRHGRGLGRQLMEFAEELARKNGLQSVRVDTHRGNLRMRALAERLGYRECGNVSYAVSAGDPIRVAYEKLIDS